MERYPTINGIAISPYQLELPKTRLDIGKPESYNNHHYEWTARAMGCFVLTRMLRNLDSEQGSLLVDVHDWLHEFFLPPELPTPYQAITRIGEAYERQEPLRFGSIHKPQIRLMTPAERQQCEDEYKKVK